MLVYQWKDFTLNWYTRMQTSFKLIYTGKLYCISKYREWYRNLTLVNWRNQIGCCERFFKFCLPEKLSGRWVKQTVGAHLSDVGDTLPSSWRRYCINISLFSTCLLEKQSYCQPFKCRDNHLLEMIITLFVFVILPPSIAECNIACNGKFL